MFTIAVAGLGSRISGVIGNLFRAAPGRVRLVGYADPAPCGLDHLGKEGIDPGRAYTDLGQLIAREKPDAVMIGSPNHLHVQQIRIALEAGRRVFSEKPVAIDRPQSLELAQLLARHGSDRLQVGLVLRSSPLFQTVRTAIRERLGRLISFEANEHLTPEHGGFIMRDWRRLRAYCGSAILEKCCHDFDLYNAMAGARGSRVSSFGGRSIFVPANQHLDGGKTADGKVRYRTWRGGWQGISEVFDSDADILDHQTALVEFANGVQLAFHTNTHSAGQRRWRLCGTGGTIESDFTTSTVTWTPASGKAEALPIIAAAGGAGEGHYGADEQMGHDLAACWLDGKVFPVPAQAAIEAGLLCMAVDAAQRSGTVVDLAPWWAELDAALRPGAAKAG